ncbi:MAG: helix-turn-helix domain-containing protein [Candidatus Marinimicrobia bacterium]|nr:helix-turn-helix domain-containing protein [Candidatus Neomarinimicrobiota bacterium]
MNKKETSKNLTNMTRNRQKEAFLESLRGGVSISDACKAVNLSRDTIWRWRKKYTGFNHKIFSIIDSRTQTVEDALYANALNGNVTAQIFWLKNRASERWRDVKNIEGSLELTFANLMKIKKEQKQKIKNNRILHR